MIILTCRNNVALSRECLRTLLDQTGHPKILLIDNASTDGTAQWARSVQARDPRVFVVTFMNPQSVSRIWNLGLDFAWQHEYEDVLVVNNDTELVPCTYELLKGLYPDAGMNTCVSVRDKRELVSPCADHPLPAPTSHPDYSCFMIRRFAHERVRFDENCVGAFYEDNVHHVEMFRAGIPALNVGLPFLHHGSMTMKNASAEERARIEVNAAQNREYFRMKYGCYPGTKGYERLFALKEMV